MNPILGFGRAVAKTFFRNVVVEGRSRLPQGGPVIFTPNHPNGLLDPILLFFLSPPFRLRFVAKAPLFRIPVFGSMLRSVGAIPVTRRMDESGEVDYTAFFSACVEALVKGDSIVIFPEGRSLPQAYLAPLKTGPARLFFMAREKGADVKIVPVGLNYEEGTVFRSRVLVAIAPPVDTSALEPAYSDNPKGTVLKLTEAIGESLKSHVIQAETYRERELMLLLERLYGSVPEDEDYRARFQRLKLFERGLASLRNTEPERIDALRSLLTRYERLSEEYGMNRRTQPWLLASLPVALLGWIFNFVPYRLVGRLVRRYDASDAATFKVVYSLFAFPATYILEGWAISRLLGPWAVIAFATLILPLSFFSQFMLDWWEDNSPRLLSGTDRARAARQLTRLRERISLEVDSLAAIVTR